MNQFEGEVIRTSGREVVIGPGGEPIPGQNTKRFGEKKSDDLFEDVDKRCKDLLKCLGALGENPEDRYAIMCHMINEVWTIRETMDHIKKELRR